MMRSFSSDWSRRRSYKDIEYKGTYPELSLIEASVCEVVVLSDFFDAALSLPHLIVFNLGHLLNLVLNEHALLAKLSLLQVLLGFVLVNLAVQVALVVRLSHLLLHSLLLALNDEFLCLILDKKLPHIDFLLISTKLRPESLVEGVCAHLRKDIFATTRLVGRGIGLETIGSRATKATKSVGSHGRRDVKALSC
jgi:hypothetical protein